jgi:hypothetical protein
MRYIEEWSPWIISLVIVVLSFFYYPDWIKMGPLIEKFPEIGTFTFGFLLTLFGLIHQGSSTVIDNFKRQRSLYKRFVHLNRNAVFVSLALTLYAYMMNNIIDLNEGETILIKVAVSLFLGGLVYFTIISAYFLMVFYRLVGIDTE